MSLARQFIAVGTLWKDMDYPQYSFVSDVYNGDFPNEPVRTFSLECADRHNGTKIKSTFDWYGVHDGEKMSDADHVSDQNITINLDCFQPCEIFSRLTDDYSPALVVNSYGHSYVNRKFFKECALGFVYSDNKKVYTPENVSNKDILHDISLRHFEQRVFPENIVFDNYHESPNERYMSSFFVGGVEINSRDVSPSSIEKNRLVCNSDPFSILDRELSSLFGSIISYQNYGRREDDEIHSFTLNATDGLKKMQHRFENSDLI